MARPTLLTRELGERFCALVEDGEMLCHAAAKVGVGERTVLRWLSDGEKDDADELHRWFWQGCEHARAVAEKAVLDRIQAKSAGGHPSESMGRDWKADQWLLGLMRPSRYRETKRTEITGAEGGPVETIAKVVLFPEVESLDAEDACGVATESGPAD